MVYDKDYYELLILIENKIESIERAGKEIGLSDEITKQLNDISVEAQKAYNEIDSLSKKVNSEKDFNNIIKKYEEYANIEKSVAVANKLNMSASNDLLIRQQELLNEIKDIKDSNGKNIDIGKAKDLFDEYQKQKDILEEHRRALLKIEQEQSKILGQTKEWKENVKIIKDGYQQVSNSIKKSFSIIKEATEYWRKQDEQITKMVATFGLTTDELKKYRDASYKAGVQLAFQYGKTQEDMVKLQQGYAESTGKNIILTKDNYEAQFQLQQLMGDENALGFTSGIEQFGVGINDARDSLYDIYKLNKTTGVSWSKTSKDLTTNLKLAQKYNFKGGLDNMMQMTVWANKMKVNLQTIGNIADSISNPEGAIETAAKLQVLGGAFSSMANPLQMLYESLDDVGGLAKRIEGMFDGLGRFDRDLGEVRIAGPDRMRVKAAAEAMGMDYQEAMSIVNNKAKRSAIEQDVKFNPEITKDNKDFLATLGQWNNKNKQFEVRTFDEQKKEYVNRNINELSNDEIDKLRQEPDEDIKKLVENTFSINANIDKLVNGAKMSLAATQEDKYGGLLRDELKNGNDMLSQMDNLGNLLNKFYLSWLILQGIKTAVGIGKMGKGAIPTLKAARDGNAPNTFGGRMATGMVGKGVSPKLMKLGGIGSAIVAGGYGIYKTVKTSKDAEENRALAIQRGDLVEGSFEDKKILREIRKGKNKGYGGAAGSAIGAGTGAWAGAAAGGAIGAAVGGIGAIPGAIIGGAIGAFGGGAAGEFVGSGIGDSISVDDGIANKKTVIKANKDDTALFAKDNGPFDKLFGNIIPKIDNIDNVLNDSNESYYNNGKEYKVGVDNSTRSSKMRNNTIYNSSVERGDNIIVPKPIGDTISKVNEISSKEKVKNNNQLADITIKPIDLNINGSIKLDMGNSGQVDIMKELKNNPTFMRELSRMLVEQMSSSLYGGKAKLDQTRFARFQS